MEELLYVVTNASSRWTAMTSHDLFFHADRIVVIKAFAMAAVVQKAAIARAMDGVLPGEPRVRTGAMRRWAQERVAAALQSPDALLLAKIPETASSGRTRSAARASASVCTARCGLSSPTGAHAVDVVEPPRTLRRA